MINTDKHKNVTKNIWKHRNFLLIASIPILMLFFVFLLAPSSSKSFSLASIAVSTPLPTDDLIYSVVIDAGVSASGLHVVSFINSNETGLKLVNQTSKLSRPGLNFFGKNASQAAESLNPLFEEALKIVPHHKQSSTPIAVFAASSLRLHKILDLDSIFAAVRTSLRHLPFRSSSTSVSLLDGGDEGSFTWLATNYLLGRFESSPCRDTVAVLHLGSESVEEAFLVSCSSERTQSSPATVPSTSTSLPSSPIPVPSSSIPVPSNSSHPPPTPPTPVKDLRTLALLNRTFLVYAHGYPRFGLREARAQIMESARPPTLRGACFARDAAGNVSHSGREGHHSFRGWNDSEWSDAKKLKKDERGKTEWCAELNLRALANGFFPNCTPSKSKETNSSHVCSMEGTWRVSAAAGALAARSYFASGFFAIKAMESGIIPVNHSSPPISPHSPSHVSLSRNAPAMYLASPQAFRAVAARACDVNVTSISDLKLRFPLAPADQLPYMCLDLSYCATLLSSGFGIPVTKNITLFRRIVYQGRMVEASWPLGAAINGLA